MSSLSLSLGIQSAQAEVEVPCTVEGAHALSPPGLAPNLVNHEPRELENLVCPDKVSLSGLFLCYKNPILDIKNKLLTLPFSLRYKLQVNTLRTASPFLCPHPHTHLILFYPTQMDFIG